MKTPLLVDGRLRHNSVSDRLAQAYAIAACQCKTDVCSYRIISHPRNLAYFHASLAAIIDPQAIWRRSLQPHILVKLLGAFRRFDPCSVKVG